MLVDNTEEMILNTKFLPKYMEGSRYFRIEYIEPESGFSNCEGCIYVGNHPQIYEILDQICILIKESYNVPAVDDDAELHDATADASRSSAGNTGDDQVPEVAAPSTGSER